MVHEGNSGIPYLCLVDGTFYNIFIVWILSYCTGWLGMPLIQTYIITIIACIFKIPFTLFGGWCALLPEPP